MKNFAYIGKSIDGFIAGINNELDWLNIVPNPNNDDMGFIDFMNSIDAIVMGKTTYQTVCAFDGEWPYNKHVFVLSDSISSIPDIHQGKVTLLKGNEIDIINEIHQKGFYNLYIDGGKTIQNFLRKNLIDEITITTIPILLGDGIKLFTSLPFQLELKHIKTKVYLEQIVQTHYQIKK